MKPIAAQQKQPVPGRNVIDGDVVYFNHAKHGPLSGRVASVGAHGVTVEHETGEDGYHRVVWDDVLGHKERRVRKLTLLERGEDGGIAVDEDGKRVFVDGQLPESDKIEPAEDLEKAHRSPAAPLLVDIGHLHGEACDCALEALHKALSDEDGLAHDIWEQHENPFIRSLIEKFSERGLTKLAKVQSDLNGWIKGEFLVPTKEVIPTPPGFMGRWSRDELELVRIYLSNIPPAEMTMDDWSMLVDYMVQRYLPPETLNEEAEWLAVKAGLMGKVQAHLGDAVSASVADALAEGLPPTVAEASTMFHFSDATEAILDYGKAHACDAVVALSDGMRHRLKRVILDHERQKLLGAEPPVGMLQQKLFDEFSALNRDWRRIAVTEAGEMANQGVIATLEVGSRVRRLEMYRGACPFCRKLDGRVFNIVAPGDPEKDGWKDVWPGKTNMGRSASPRKRVGAALVEREDSERLWPAAGVQHPHCRGRWEPMQAAKPGHDKDFAAWLRKRLGQVEGVSHGEG